MMSEAVSGRKKTKPSSGAVFTSTYKLRKAIEFKRVFKNPVVSSDQFFKILARLNQEENSRLGMAVSRQVDKRAVGRNRIKRVVRESFRHRYSREKICLDIVVLPRRETATICNKRLFRSLQGHWSRLENQFEG
jgi:ribonuclease P protein component